jgi:hypothetical protein
MYLKPGGFFPMVCAINHYKSILLFFALSEIIWDGLLTKQFDYDPEINADSRFAHFLPEETKTLSISKSDCNVKLMCMIDETKYIVLYVMKYRNLTFYLET